MYVCCVFVDQQAIKMGQSFQSELPVFSLKNDLITPTGKASKIKKKKKRHHREAKLHKT